MKRKNAFAGLSVMLILLLGACGNPSGSGPGDSLVPDGPDDDGITGTYTGSKSGITYSLVTNAAEGKTAVDDSYIFTAKKTNSGQESTGTILAVENNTIELQPSFSGAPSFKVTVSGSRMTFISGIITFDDGTTMTGPNSLSSGGGGGGGGGGGSGQPAVIAVTGVSLKPSTSIAVGGSELLTPTIAPSNATNRNVTWLSGNTAVATVTADGTVTANAAGTAIITVTTVDGAKTAACTVTVTTQTIPVSGVSLNKTSASLTVGGSETLTPTISPSNATNQNITWSSNNTSVATVAAEGTVTAKAVGTAIITVTTADGGKIAACTVTVTTVPGAPQNFSAAPGNTEVTLSWTAPASDGGSPITRYEVSKDNGANWVPAGGNTGHTFTGLVNGTSHTFKVRAVNVNGGGAEATVRAAPIAPVITITTQPAAATNVTAGSISGDLSVSASVTQGAVPSYRWYSNTAASNSGGTPINGATGASFPIPQDLAAGVYYYFCEVSAAGAAPVRSNAARVTVTAAVIPVTFNSLSSDGSSTVTTTQLTLVFNKNISGLSAADITLNGLAGIVKGALTSSGSGVYFLPVSGFSSGGTVSVSVAKTGYTITGGPKTTTVHYKQNAPTGNATFNITFDQISDLSLSDIDSSIVINRRDPTSTATLSVTNPAQYSKITWHIGRVTVNGSSITLTRLNTPSSSGLHSLTLEVIKDGKLYDKAVTYTVANN